MKKLLMLTANIVLLSACAHNPTTVPASVILEHRADYADAHNGVDLVIRPPLSDYLISHQFDI